MRQLTATTALIIALATAMSGCGTKGPLFLPSQAQQSPAQAAVTAPAPDPITGTGQH